MCGYSIEFSKREYGVTCLDLSVHQLAVNSVRDNATYRSNTFDFMTFRDHSITAIVDDSVNKKVLECSQRYYVTSEKIWLIKSLGSAKINIFDAKLGAFSQNNKLKIADFKMFFVAVN